MKTRLTDVCEIIVDCKNRTAPIDEHGDFYAVGTPAMRGNVIDYIEARRINSETFAEWTSRLVPKEGDLLLAREAPVGPVVRVPAGGRVAAGQRTTLLRADPAKADSVFLRHYLISSQVQERLLSHAHGSTVSHLRVGDIRNFEVDLPDIVEQRRTAALLGAIDEKIAANEKVDHLTHKLLETEFSSVLHGSTREFVSIDRFVEFGPSHSGPRASEPPYVDMAKLPEVGSGVKSWSRRPAKGGSRFMNGDTLLARITPCLENRKTGYVDFLDDEEIGIGSTEFIVLRAREPLPKPVSYFFAVERDFRDHAIRHMSGTSGRQRVSARDLANFEVPTLDTSWLIDFGKRAESSLDALRVARAEARVLSRIRDTLLPALMSGKLRVKDAERAVEDVL